MAESSLDNSAQGEKPSYASRILLTDVKEGYAIVRVRLKDYFAKCSPSLIHEYLWALCGLIDQVQTEFDNQWEVKIRKRMETLSE